MKTLILSLLLVSSAAIAHEIRGTQILKGTAKTRVIVTGIDSKCDAKVDDVKNTMTEDSYGNPAYRVWIKMELNGRGEEGARVSYSNTIRFLNIHPEGTGSKVSDELYRGENEPTASMRIDQNGRIKTVVFPVGAQTVTCQF